MVAEWESDSATIPRRKGMAAVLFAEIRCVLATLGLLRRNELAQPREEVGRVIEFADCTRSRIYRETVMRSRCDDGLVLMVVRFRLRLIGTSRLGHWLFRCESVLNTVLFAGHRGFQTKLWLTDSSTGYYRGIYEWRGRTSAEEYAETLRVVLHPGVEQGSFAYRVIENQSRQNYLEGLVTQSQGAVHAGQGWWLPKRFGCNAL
jgi:hypothetical protein